MKSASTIIIALLILFLLVLGSLYLLLRHNEPDCFIADQITVLDNGRYRKQKVTLILRATGWHDKTRYIELYKAPVTFDICGKANQPFIAGDSIDEPERGPKKYWVAGFTLKGDQIRIRYTKNKRKSVPATALKLPAKYRH
jgi:hypothetical protein